MSKFDPKNYENKWSEKWEAESVYKTPSIEKGDDKAYILDMYPYPSGSGLHVGHPRGYLATDVVSRFERMNGKKVLYPMGFDSFGLPAENYAIKTNVHPEESTNKAIKMFKSQIENIGLSYDWDRELMSHDPEYMKWTQWIFLKMYKAGKAYQKEAPVNWCPTDNTVLANEQVEADGTCERCGSEVIQKNMKQWFFKITDYADRLISDLDKIDWPESTKLGQKNWIGKSEGAKMRFKVVSSSSDKEITELEVFTTAFDTVYGATFMVIAPEHDLININKSEITNIDDVNSYVEESKKKTELDRRQNKEKSGIKIEGIEAINPVNGKKIPVFVADYVLVEYGSGAIMAVPAHDERDFEFANKYNLEIVPVVEAEDIKDFISYSADVKKNPSKYSVINSESFNGKSYKVVREEMMQEFEKKDFAERTTEYKLRDWLVSRQRFWGCPIPIVYDPEGNPHPASEDELPIRLPMDIDFKPTGESPLRYSESFHKSAEEKYGKGWRREVDTLDTFMDSSWYFFRFTDVKNKEEFASAESMNKWMPVDLYIGGAEHTVLHLMYARFFTKFFFDEGYIDFDEPFQKLRHQGMILAEDSRKMSKRWGNTIDPNEEIEKYGADTLRIYEMFMAPFNSTTPWSTETEVGVFRFLGKIWDQSEKVDESFESDEQEKMIHKLIKKVTEDINSMSFNTAVAKMMEFVNFVSKEEKINKSVWERFILVIAPFGPFISEELWNKSGNEFSVHKQSWPSFDEAMTIESSVEMGVQINGKVRGSIQIAVDATEENAIELALAEANIQKYVGDNKPKKIIYIPGKILNIIV
ncbi:MAG: leucine--tRNA ligase [Candidatus Dojkabacteria bacterium]|nr:leucine--tRNA ligase [Candidatus Dojkabacteria bacterium]MDQ7020508.1 leucine--tRNA ligase [Candidatus Dojkabacteria bacterium]